VGFKVTSVEWAGDGRSIVIMDNDKFCVSFPLEEVSENKL
jgi:hypothetical protein